ncbi:hypothetical protein RyT2_20720 [Pseudolactococcus yaeyamensis]
MQVTQEIKKFQKNTVEDCLKLQMIELDRYFHDNLEALANRLAQPFQIFIDQLESAQQQDGLKPIGFIMVSWLRSPFLANQELSYEWHSYGENWYYDTIQESIIQRFDGFERFIQAFQTMIQAELLERESQELFKQERYYVSVYFEVFQRYFVELMRFLLKKKGATLFEKLRLADEFHVYVGEFKDKSQVVYEKVTTLITQSDLDDYLSSGKMEAEGIKNFVEKSFKHANLSNQTFVFANFWKSDLTGAELKESILVGSQFVACQLEQANFQSSFIQDADFSHAKCRHANFQSVKGNLALAIEAVPSYFGVNFSYADLRETDFRGAQLRGANFEHAQLENALFLTSQKDKFNLSPEQIKEIKWV